MAKRLDPRTRAMVDRNPDYQRFLDDDGNEHVVDTTRRNGPKARKLASALGLGQLRQADQRGQGYQRPSDADIEERIKARQRQEAEVQRDARRKMFGID
jgi:hypothetical protein